jgi:hypothetical protein
VEENGVIVAEFSELFLGQPFAIRVEGGGLQYGGTAVQFCQCIMLVCTVGCLKRSGCAADHD